MGLPVPVLKIGGLEDWRVEGLEDWRVRGLESWRVGGLEGLRVRGPLPTEEAVPARPPASGAPSQNILHR